MRELLARVKANLRRADVNTDDKTKGMLTIDKITIDFAKYEVTKVVIL